MTEPLTYEAIKKGFEVLSVKFPSVELEVYLHPILKFTGTAIICGNKIYYWHDIFECMDPKIIELPETNFDIQPPEFKL